MGIFLPMKLPFDIAADLDTPVSAYLKLRPLSPCFLLESVEGGMRVGRYSFVGFGDRQELRLEASGLWLDGKPQARPGNAAALLEVLRQARARAPQLQPLIEGIPLVGGLVGYSSYDLVRYFENLPAGPAPLPGVPQACYVAPKSMLVFDHLTRGVSLLHDGDESERQQLKGEVIKLLRGPLPGNGQSFSYAPATASLSRGEFIERVRQVQGHISAGDVYQLVLSVCFSGECNVDPFQAYRALRLLNPSPYMYFCEAGGLQVVGSSPEALVRLNGTLARLRPIAGTLPRGSDSATDESHARQLLADPKENAEHVMLVDLARNDLGRVARAGTVRVEPFRVIERYSHVMHMVSGVSGELAPGRDAFDLFAAAFPAGTLVGAPKVRAMEIIDQLEPVSRGLYGGTVGYFGASGDMDHAITIRTLVFADGRYSYQAGAGIVADSNAGREHDEVMAKGAVMRRALEMAGAGL